MTANLMASPLPYLRRFRIVEKDDHSQLLANVANSRCESSYKELFDHYAPKIYRYGIKHKLNESQASDLVQEVMTRLWLKSHLFDESKGSVSTWIFTLSRNLKFDLLRKNVSQSHVISSDELWDSATFDQIDQDANLEALQEKFELHSLVDQLPKDQRDVIKKIYFEGFTQEEYSTTNNIPLGTVKSRIRLAIRKLNSLMEIL